MRSALTTTRASERYARDPAAFADDLVRLNEKGKPWRLSAYQRRVLALAFRWSAAGALLMRLLLWSEVKKSGKTFIAAFLGLWWAFTNPTTEIIVAANDLEQSVGRVFKTMVALLKHNPELGASATIRAAEIQVSNGTVITAISSDYRGAAGSRHSLVIFDELWGFTLERAERLFEELTPPPTEPNAWVLVATTAGFVGESMLLERLYQRGLGGERLDDELELYRADDLVMFWSHTPRQEWQTPAYYAEQARSLRPLTFARLHRNEWGSAESALITPELWDGCTETTWGPADPDPALPAWKAVDLGFKSDGSAVVEITVDPDTGQIVLVRHRIWTPKPGAPLDSAAIVEAYLRATAEDFHTQTIYFDPWQGYGLIRRLQDAGLPAREFPQTEGNTARAGETLYNLLRSRRLVLYPDAELRAQAMNAVGIEGSRGVRIAKASASRKVDAIVALAMACVAAVDVPPRAPLRIWSIA